MSDYAVMGQPLNWYRCERYVSSWVWRVDWNYGETLWFIKNLFGKHFANRQKPFSENWQRKSNCLYCFEVGHLKMQQKIVAMYIYALLAVNSFVSILWHKRMEWNQSEIERVLIQLNWIEHNFQSRLPIPRTLHIHRQVNWF